MTTSVNQTLTDAEQIFYDLIWQPMIKAGETWLAGVQATVPVLDIPMIQGLEDDAINAIAAYTFKQIVLFVDIESIKLINTIHQSAWENASLQLAIVAQEYGVGSPEYQTARDNARSALSKFTNITG